MLDTVAHQTALNRIMAIANTYYVSNGRFPARIRLGAGIARDFLGMAVEGHFPVPLPGPRKTVLVIVDKALSATGVALDD